MDRICREDIAILVRDHKGSLVLAPYWWYHLCFGLDPKKVIRKLVEESRFVDATKVLEYFVMVNGYIQLTTPASAQELLQELTPLVKGHPHSACWNRMLDRLAAYWNTDHSPKLISAAYAGDRKVYLLSTDRVTRLVDMRKFVGHGLKEADVETEERFRDGLTMVTEALVWMPAAGERRRSFSQRICSERASLWMMKQPWVSGIYRNTAVIAKERNLQVKQLQNKLISAWWTESAFISGEGMFLPE